MIVSGDVTATILRTERFEVVGSTGITWASGDLMQSFFGIDGTQSAASGLPQFDAGSGLRDVGMQFGANYKLNDSWSVFGGGGYGRLLGDAKRSPLVSQRGARNQAGGAVGVIYSF